jgi:hypothetical protein
MLRVPLLIASVVCFVMAIVYARQWDWFGIDHGLYSAKGMHTWALAGLICFSGSFLPWGVKLRYWLDSTRGGQ